MKDIVFSIKKHKLLVSVPRDSFSKVLSHAIHLRIPLSSIEYKKDEVFFTIEQENYALLKKSLFYVKLRKVKDTGIFSFPSFLAKNQILLICLCLGLCLFYFLTHVIVKVEVIHSNKNIRDLVTDELYDLGIKRLTMKKDYASIQEIKKTLLDKYPKQLEWVEIEVRGMEYVVHVEERIITEKEPEKESCHVVATKDALITRVVSHKGQTLKNIDQYVKEGDILISGNIVVDTETKGTVCASGTVYGETWYTVNVEVPMQYEEREFTNKNRYNLMIEYKNAPYVILRSRLEQKEVENKRLVSLWGTKLYLQKEREYKSIWKNYDEETALEKALLLSEEKMKLKLDEDERILTQKVLKKSINDSTMSVEVFVSVEEKISTVQEFQKEVE